MTRLEDRLNRAEAWLKTPVTVEGFDVMREALNLVRDFREMLHRRGHQADLIDQLHEQARDRQEKNDRQANLIVQMRDRASENVERMHELVTENALLKERLDSLKERLDKQGIRLGELREQRQGSYEEGFRLGVEAEREAQRLDAKDKARTVDPWQDAADVQAEVPEQQLMPEDATEVTTQAENPVEYRLLDAYQTGVIDGMQLGHNIKGRF